MALTRSFKFITHKSLSINILIKELENFGWRITNNGCAEYLPFGDKGEYNWQMHEISNFELKKIIEKKSKTERILG